MIYTVTFNPALDYVVKLDKLNIGDINRTTDEKVYYGGKGINVSMVLTHLGIENIALGFIGGFTGEAIEHGLNEMGIKTDFIKLSEGFSRINVKVCEEKETAINGQGPIIKDNDLKKLFQKINCLKEGDILVLAGSIPSTVPEDIYEKLMFNFKDKQIQFVVDATKDLLLNSLKYKPFLIKPNQDELSEIFKKELINDEEIVFYANELKKLGARNVLVSRGEKGAILVLEDGKVKKSGVVKGKVLNTVGAGDSMVAGFLAGWIERKDFEYALLLGSAAGMATAYSEGIAGRDEINNILLNLSTNSIQL